MNAYGSGSQLFGGRGHLSEEGIAVSVDALNGKRYDSLPVTLLTHIEGCYECRRGIIDTLSLVQEAQEHLSRSRSSGSEMPRRSRSFASNTYRIAAAIAVCLSAGAIVYLAQNLTIDRGSNLFPRSQDTAAAERSNLQGETQQIEANGNYSRSPNLEELANAVTRSTSVRVVSPTNGSTVGREISFAWKNGDRISLTLEILSNTDKTLYKYTRQKSPLHFAGHLKPGLYYWKLVGENELIYMGKFVVR